jgi:hypothetical protein
MKILKTAALFSICIVLMMGSGYAESTGQEKLMAKRAATVDAYRNLAEKVNGLQINAQTYVRDFVAASDQVNTALDAFLKGARVTNTRYLPDGTCEVDVEMGVKELVRELETIKKQTGFLIFWQTVYFDKITEYYKESIVKATGAGVPPEKYSAGTAQAAAAAPDWSSRKEVATGTGVPPKDATGAEARIMAERAAKLDGLRNLAERVYGVKIDSSTTVKDFVTKNDQIKAEVDAFLRGAEVSDTRYKDDGSVEVDVSVDLNGVWGILKNAQ